MQVFFGQTGTVRPSHYFIDGQTGTVRPSHYFMDGHTGAVRPSQLNQAVRNSVAY